MVFFESALYHLQQAYEKCVKSYYIFKETRFNNTSETDAYDSVKQRLGHDTQESTIALLRDIAQIENNQFEAQLRNATDPTLLRYLQALRKGINGLNTSLDRMATRLDLRNNYTHNVRNYGKFVTDRYSEYQSASNGIIAKQSDQGFLQKLLSMAVLYPCFYRMDQTTRYPLPEFNYDNLDLLTDLRQPCENLIEMMGDLFTLLKPELDTLPGHN